VSDIALTRRVSPAAKTFPSPQPQIAVQRRFRHDCGHKKNTGAPVALPINNLPINKREA
jgi:hypothetical protein